MRKIPGTGDKTCLRIFLFPFYLFGGLVLIGAVVQVVTGDYQGAFFLGVFGGVFVGLPTLILLGVRAGLRNAAEAARLKEEHPAEPWMWKQEWAAGRLETSARTGLIVAWVFAILWNAVSIPGAVVLLPQTIASGEWVGLLFLVFPFIGSLLLVWAVRTTIRHRKYGVSVFEMAHVPGVLGRGIGGLLRTSVDLRPVDGFVAQLTCVNRVTTGSGDKRTTTENVQWQEKETITEYLDDADGVGVMVPIAFRIPATAPPTDETNSGDAMVWRLNISADVPGVDYSATFEVPVFATEATERGGPSQSGDESSEEESSQPFEQPPESRIQVTRHRDRLRIFFPAARNPGVGIGLTVVSAGFGAAVVTMLNLNAPLLFLVIFGGVDLLLIWLTVIVWMGVTEVKAEPGVVEVRRGLLVARKSIRLVSGEIQSIEVRPGMQSGKTHYTDIKIITTGGRTVNAGSNLLRKREAEWIVSLIKQATGV